jgi:cytochrome b561
MSLVGRIRQWAARHTGRNVYSPVGRAFHWIMAALVFFQLWWGWWVGRLPVGPDKLEGYQVHSQVGVALLVLLLFRALWRSIIPGPVNDADKPGWESTAARITHFVFYFLLVTLPLSGWVMWSAMAFDQPLSLVGVAPWPLLPLQDLPLETRWAIMQWSETIHFWLILALLGTILVHTGAALKHHFIDRDDVLAGMTPFIQPLRTDPATEKRRWRDRRSRDPTNAG